MPSSNAFRFRQSRLRAAYHVFLSRLPICSQGNTDISKRMLCASKNVHFFTWQVFAHCISCTSLILFLYNISSWNTCALIRFSVTNNKKLWLTSYGVLAWRKPDICRKLSTVLEVWRHSRHVEKDRRGGIPMTEIFINIWQASFLRAMPFKTSSRSSIRWSRKQTDS